MSRKHYELIASALAGRKPEAGSAKWGQWAYDCMALADVFVRDNVRFDRARFLEACGLEVL